MARGKTYIVQHRRRRQGKTDYRARLALLKSGKPRLVIRKSSKNITCQIVEYDSNGDKVIVSADSRKLKDYGWNGHCGNIPAAYLTGLLCGTEAKKKGVKEAVPDMGIYVSVKGSRLYSALKGVADGGVNIPHSEQVLPAEDRIKGEKTSNSEKSKKEFSAAKEKILSMKTKTEKTQKEKTESKPAEKTKEKDSSDKPKQAVKSISDITKRPI